jgi:hypothetical protein
MKRLALLLPLILIGLCDGCRRQAASTGPGQAQWQQSDANWQAELLTYAVDNLDQMEKYQTQETLFGIVRQIYSLQQAAADKDKSEKIDPISAGWPESEIFNQVLDRLNQWVRFQTPAGDWKADAMVESLPNAFKELPDVKELGGMEFSTCDGYFLMEAACVRDAALWARGDALEDLTRAKNLFAWTIRNIQLEMDDQHRVPLFPWEALFFGRGTAMERAWVFILLARQQGLEAALLGLADGAGKEAEAGERNKPVRQWCVAVLIEGKAYLFDPFLGLPIPAKGGVRRDGEGRLEIEPATLADILADGSLLKRLDVDSKRTYPVKPENLKKLVALVEASPAALSYRMKLVESHLAGKQKMVLTASASEQAGRWKAISGIGGAEIWRLPYETIARRRQLDVQEIVGQLGEWMRFYAMPNAPLAKGRWLQIKGQFSGQDGATGFYQAARPSFADLGNFAQLPANQDLDKIKQEVSKRKAELLKANNDPTTAPSPLLQGQKKELEEIMADVDLAKMLRRLEEEYIGIVTKGRQFKSDEEKNAAEAAFQRQAVEILMRNILYGKEDATYWLALAAYDRGNYASAEDYLSKRILERTPNSPWRHGALFNLAQTAEAAGQIERAAMIYQSDAEAPDAYGRLLRARWLTEKDTP